MFHDESIYPSSQTYDPERYLKDGKLDPYVKDPEERVFGSGRRCELCDTCVLVPSWYTIFALTVLRTCAWLSADRICPGRYFAIRMIFLNIACILTLFDIEAPIGEKLEAKFNEEQLIRYVTVSDP